MQRLGGPADENAGRLLAQVFEKASEMYLASASL